MSKPTNKDMSDISPESGDEQRIGTKKMKQAPKRFWAKHKADVVLRLLRGEDIDVLSRELGVTAARLSKWRNAFLASGADGLKKLSSTEEAEYKRLNEKIGEQTMEIELLREKIRLLEAKEPLMWRRSRK